MSKFRKTFKREQSQVLFQRLQEPRRFIQVVSGPRQVGKSTMVQQVVERLEMPTRYASADEPTLRGSEWIAQQWNIARLDAASSTGAVLALDEIQKIDNWSETVKRLWDEDTRNNLSLKVIILGSSPLLVARGLSESLAGRFEKIVLPHWSFAEMKTAFDFTIDEFIYYGGYPGAAPLIEDPARWRSYIIDSLIETTISRDVLLMTRVDKPALLRQLFELVCRYSSQILSYNKMLGQLHDAGNTTTLAHYLELLAGAGIACGIPKYSGNFVRKRASSPKLQILNSALLSAVNQVPLTVVRADPKIWGRLVESAVGAHLANAELQGELALHYWREGNLEVDFVVQRGETTTAIEVKSGRTAPLRHAGTAAFVQKFNPQRSILIGGDGIPLEDFLSHPAVHWAGRDG